MKPYYEESGIVIYHGDCREILPQLGPVDVVITDPPYGINHRSGMNGHHGDCAVAGDENTEYRDEALRLTNCPGLVFGKWNVQAPIHAKAALVWEKGEHTGMGDLALPWKPNWELIYVLGGGRFCGNRTSGVLKHLAIAGCVGVRTWRYHPDEKPESLMKALLQKTWGNICDPFMGSGTTLVAAKNLGRKAIGIEIEERYCEVAVKRLGQSVMQFGVAERV